MTKANKELIEYKINWRTFYVLTDKQHLREERQAAKLISAFTYFISSCPCSRFQFSASRVPGSHPRKIAELHAEAASKHPGAATMFMRLLKYYKDIPSISTAYTLATGGSSIVEEVCSRGKPIASILQELRNLYINNQNISPPKFVGDIRAHGGTDSLIGLPIATAAANYYATVAHIAALSKMYKKSGLTFSHRPGALAACQDRQDELIYAFSRYEHWVIITCDSRLTELVHRLYIEAIIDETACALLPSRTKTVYHGNVAKFAGFSWTVGQNNVRLSRKLRRDLRALEHAAQKYNDNRKAHVANLIRTWAESGSRLGRSPSARTVRLALARLIAD